METYLDLTALSFDTCFRAALKETGLANIFERAVVREIADSVESVFLGKAFSTSRLPDRPPIRF